MTRRVALVTGAGRGIGREIALGLARATPGMRCGRPRSPWRSSATSRCSLRTPPPSARSARPPGLDPNEIHAALAINVVGPMTLSAAVLPAMRSGGWGRIVNVSSGIVGHPEMMIGGTVYAATKAALEAHTVNLAAEVAGTGVTVNAYRPGTVDTSMQEGIRSRSPEEIGAAVHERFTEMHTSGSLTAAAASAAALLDHLPGDEFGEIWSFGEG